MLHQDSWSAADDLGRIKVVISEVYHSGPSLVETVKNIVAFSFQHAPLRKSLNPLFPTRLVIIMHVYLSIGPGLQVIGLDQKFSKPPLSLGRTSPCGSGSQRCPLVRDLGSLPEASLSHMLMHPGTLGQVTHPLRPIMEESFLF